MKNFLVVISELVLDSNSKPTFGEEIRTYEIKATDGFGAKCQAQKLLANEIKYIPTMRRKNYDVNKLHYDYVEI